MPFFALNKGYLYFLFSAYRFRFGNVYILIGDQIFICVHVSNVFLCFKEIRPREGTVQTGFISCANRFHILCISRVSYSKLVNTFFSFKTCVSAFWKVLVDASGFNRRIIK